MRSSFELGSPHGERIRRMAQLTSRGKDGNKQGNRYRQFLHEFPFEIRNDSGLPK
jgi:hypothetical protein